MTNKEPQFEAKNGCDLPLGEDSLFGDREASAGWAEIAELLAGFKPEQVDSLVEARELESMYPLLHSLARGSLRDFLVRVGALEALVKDGRSPLSPEDIRDILFWLQDSSRDLLLRTLRESGWISYETSSGYRLTDVGQFVSMVISFLYGKVNQVNLLPTIEGIDYMTRLGVDPMRQVLLLRAQLQELGKEMEEARKSHSEVILKGADKRLQEVLSLSERIRHVLSAVPLEMIQARKVAQDVHDLLSRLHGIASDLHAAITEVGRQYLNLVDGLTTTDIIATLMKIPIDELAEIGRTALYPMFSNPPFVVPELLAAEAETYLSRQIELPPKVEWKEPPETELVNAQLVLPEEISRLLDNLDRIVEEEIGQPLAEFVPHGNASESFLRASLLPLVGEKVGGEGIAGRLGALKLAITIKGDGFPKPSSKPLSEITPGSIDPIEERDSHG